MKNIFATLAFCTFIAISQSSIADTIHSLGDQSPSGFSQNNYFYNNARGWAFTAGVSDINVTQLGIDPVTSGSYTISLWDFASQTVLAQTTISNVVGGTWNWANLASNVSLVSGNEYLVMGIGNTPEATYYYGNNLPASWYPTGDITYDQMMFCNTCTANTFPTDSFPGFQYGVVDIGYTVGNVAAVPEPETYGMMMAGLGLLGFMVRRKKSA